MNIFDFIEKELSDRERDELFTDKTVCLCLFRALTPLEQQLLYKFLFLDSQRAKVGLKPRDLANALQNPGSAMRDSAPSPRRNDARTEQAKAFCKKLQNFGLITEVEEERKDGPDVVGQAMSLPARGSIPSAGLGQMRGLSRQNTGGNQNQH